MSAQIKKISDGVPIAPEHTRKHWIFIIAIVLLVLVLLAGSIILFIDSIRFLDKILLVLDYTTPTYDTPVLAAAVKYAMAHEAQHLVLYGWSQAGQWSKSLCIIQAFPTWNANPQVYNNEPTAFLKQKLSL